jgi:hypothetical protein
MNDTRSGDLPSHVTILLDLHSTQCAVVPLTTPFDQGRAMMQIMHDVAPGARFVFRSAIFGVADMAVGMNQLVAAGCDIIVSAVRYQTDPFFQNGIVAQAVDQVISQGVSFFVPVGELGRTAWDAVGGFVPVQVNTTSFNISATNATTEYHQFGIDKNGNTIISQRIAVQNAFTNVPFVFFNGTNHFFLFAEHQDVKSIWM